MTEVADQSCYGVDPTKRVAEGFITFPSTGSLLDIYTTAIQGSQPWYKRPWLYPVTKGAYLV